MTDILLFNQYFTSKKESTEKIFATLPINLLCLASYLKQNNIDSKIYELGMFDLKQSIIQGSRIRFGIADEQIAYIIKNESPKVIGLGCMYSRHYIDIISIARLIKKVDPVIRVVLGGNHATSFSDMVLKEQAIDFVVRGEGEITFFELCKHIISNQNDYKSIDGLAYRKDQAIIKTKDRGLIKDLNDLPPLDYSMVDVKRYGQVSYNSPFLMRYPGIGIVSSRGCPGKCIYCTVKAVWGRSWRGVSATRTVDEIQLLREKYGINEFAFLDDSASLNKKRWNDISDEIINRKLDIKWNTPNGIAHWTLDKPTIKKMKKAGCNRITFGIESGFDETRQFLGKPYKLSQAKEMIKYANKIGLWTISTNILGFPYEKKESMDATVRFSQKSGTDFATFYLLCPMVTSDVYKYFKKEGLLDFDFIYKDNVFDEESYEKMNEIVNDGGAPTKYFTIEQLKEIQLKAYRRFIAYRALSYIVNPLRLARKIRSVEDLFYVSRLVIQGSKILTRSLYAKGTKALLWRYN